MLYGKYYKGNYDRKIISFFKKMGQPWPLFVYFCSFQQQFYRKMVDFSGESNSDRRSRRQARWPLDHHNSRKYEFEEFRTRYKTSCCTRYSNRCNNAISIRYHTRYSTRYNTRNCTMYSSKHSIGNNRRYSTSYTQSVTLYEGISQGIILWIALRITLGICRNMYYTRCSTCYITRYNTINRYYIRYRTRHNTM